LVDAPVTYVVAADRRWLYDSYARIYRDFRSVSREPGRPLGHLFLEKTFQVSASLPQLAYGVRDNYWQHLIVGDSARNPGDDAHLVEQAERDLEGATLQEALGAAGKAGSLEEQQAIVTAAANRLGSAEVQREIRHRLAPFGPLLEPNPRAMKRLVNAYRIELKRMLAEGRRVGRAAATPEQLALWTILSLRWPLLADHLAKHPELVNSGVSPNGSDPLEGDAAMRQLRESREVEAVIRGDGVPAFLTTEAVRALVGMDPQGAARTTVPVA
jgi:hypothetical protein